MEHVSTIGLLCTCTSCLLLSDTLFHTEKAETTSLDETGDNIVLSEQEAQRMTMNIGEPTRRRSWCWRQY